MSLSLLIFPFPSHANYTTSVDRFTNVQKIVQDKRGFVWLAGQQGLTRVDGDRSITFSLSNQEWPLPFSWVHDVEPINDKLLIATEIDGLWLFDTRNGEAKKIPVKTPKESYYDVIMFKKHYYINAPNNLYRFDPITNSTQIIHRNIKISNLVHSKERLYIANNDGLYQLKDDKLIQVINEPITALTALSNAIIAITPTKIYKLTDHDKQTSIKHKEKLYGLTKAFDNDNFFTISLKGKVSKYDSSTLTALPHYYGDSEPVHLRSAFHDASGVLWLTSSHGVEQISENYIKNHDLVFDIPINGNEIALFDNEIIVASYGAGLQNFFEPVFNQEINADFTKKGLKIFNVIEINQSLYIGSFDGLWRYDKNTNKVTKLDIIDNKLVLNLERKNNLFYIATNDHGLYIYDLTTEKVIKHIGIVDGLPSAEVIDVLPLDSGILWIASSNNISIYHPLLNKLTTLATPIKVRLSLLFTLTIKYLLQHLAMVF